MEIIDHLMSLSKHQNTVLGFLAFALLKMLKQALIAIEQAFHRLRTALFGEEVPLFI